AVPVQRHIERVAGDAPFRRTPFTAITGGELAVLYAVALSGALLDAVAGQGIAHAIRIDAGVGELAGLVVEVEVHRVGLDLDLGAGPHRLAHHLRLVGAPVELDLVGTQHRLAAANDHIAGGRHGVGFLVVAERFGVDGDLVFRRLRLGDGGASLPPLLCVHVRAPVDRERERHAARQPHGRAPGAAPAHGCSAPAASCRRNAARSTGAYRAPTRNSAPAATIASCGRAAA